MTAIGKVRCFVVDRSSGNPLAGVTVSLSAENAAGATVVLGMLTSDQAGYVSFDLANSGPLPSAAKLWLTPQSDTASRINILAAKDNTGPTKVGPHVKGTTPGLDTGAAAPCVSYMLSVRDTVATRTAGCGSKTLASVQSPDLCDFQLSPGSFVVPGAKMIGEGSCESLVPSAVPTQSYTLRRVIVRSTVPAATETPAPAGRAVPRSATSGGKSSSFQPINVAQPPPVPTGVLSFGEVLEYRQEWLPLGHSLGEIRYSLALAPGEATEIAVVDWSRQDQASRTDDITSTEYLANQLNRDRSIGETVNSMLSETQDGWSLMGGTAGDSSYSYGTFAIAADHSVGGAIAHSSGDRNLEGDSLQSLHDSTNQATAVTRRLNSTVIMQSSQAEQNVLQTRRVANHNHCHALTVEYYEVLRNFRLRTRFVGRRKAILIPFAPFTFEWTLAVRFRSMLVANLLDSSLSSAFDAILRYHYGSNLYQPAPETTTTTTPATSNYFTGHKSLTIDPTVPNDPQLFIQKGSRVRLTTTGKVKVGGIHDINSSGYDPDGDGNTAGNGYYAPGKYEYSLILRFGSTWYQGGSSADIVTSDDNYIVFQVNDQIGNLTDNSGSWDVELDVIAPAATPAAPTDPTSATTTLVTGAPTKDGDAFLQTVLLQHLNGNRGYYNRVVWLTMDDSDRRLFIEAGLDQSPGVAAGVDSTPLAVSGNVIAFGYDGPIANWSDTRQTDPSVPLESLVALPTRGVFAEAMLGHCNACEKRDVSRMWDWTVMTTEEPPAITGVTPGPRGTPDTVTQGTLPQNVVQISQPPTEPDPVGLAAALRVIGTPNIFRDMSGLQEVNSLLNTLANGAVTSLAGAQKVAQQAQQKLQAVQQGQSGTATGSSAAGVQTRTAPNDSNAGSQVDKLNVIGQAKQAGLISDQQATDATIGVLGGEVIPAAWFGSTTPTGQGTTVGGKTYPALDMNIAVPGERNCCTIFPGGVGGLFQTDYMDYFNLGHHVYGAYGVLPEDPVGQVYSARGGFLDIAHIRDNADMARYIATRAYNSISAPSSIDLNVVGGTAHIGFLAFPTGADPVDLVATIGARAAFELAVWHEIATWFTSQRYSSFSPEDNYSNLVGALIGATAVTTPASDTVRNYNDAVDKCLNLFVQDVGGQTGDVALKAAQSVTGLWFASANAVGEALVGGKLGVSPDSQNLLWRRHLIPLPAVTPWLVTDLDGLTFNYSDPIAGTLSNTVDFSLGAAKPAPKILTVPVTSSNGTQVSTCYTLSIDVDTSIVPSSVLPTGQTTIASGDLSGIVSAVRALILQQYPRGDKPS